MPWERNRKYLRWDIPPLYRIGATESAGKNASSRRSREGGGSPPDPHPRQWARDPSGGPGPDLRPFLHHEKDRDRDRSLAGSEDRARAWGRPRHEQRSRERDR